MLTVRKLVQSKLHDVEMSVRGTLRGFGLKMGETTRRGFAARARELVSGHPTLEELVEVLLRPREALLREFNLLEKRVRQMARTDARARLLATTPGVGPVVGLTFVAAIDDPARFKSSKTVGAHFGLVPRRFQSGEMDYDGRVSKCGDAMMRTALYEAAQVLLTRTQKWSWLKAWGMQVARRRGAKKAIVALARRLAVVLHRMWVDGTEFRWRKEADAAAAA